jgi:hypothetical protein
MTCYHRPLNTNSRVGVIIMRQHRISKKWSIAIVLTFLVAILSGCYATNVEKVKIIVPNALGENEEM